MTVGEFLQTNTPKLQQAGIESARLDCLVLLEDALGVDRAYILAHPEAKIDQKTEANLNKKIAQRSTHKPLAYIRGKAMFYGREFIVSSGVLVPRPESESLIDLLLAQSFSRPPRIVDIGTGSGCLGITAALEMVGTEIWLVDIDKNSLALAERNTIRHRTPTHLIESDLLQKVHTKFDVVLANLPYVPEKHVINKAASHEPRHALFAGPDGLDAYRQLWNQITHLSTKPKFVIIESLQTQHENLLVMASESGYRLQSVDELAQCFKLA